MSKTEERLAEMKDFKLSVFLRAAADLLDDDWPEGFREAAGWVVLICGNGFPHRALIARAHRYHFGISDLKPGDFGGDGCKFKDALQARYGFQCVDLVAPEMSTRS